MSGALAHFIGEDDGPVAKFVRGAEKLCGHPSEDVRLLSATSLKVRDKISQLGLDPADTTDQELYYTLRARAEKDNQLFGRHYGFEYTEELFNYCTSDEKVFALKSSMAKNLLSANPPKQLMKKLNYRSAESMIKRESTLIVLGLALKTESALWRQKFSRQLKKVSANDFQEQRIELIKLPDNMASIVSNSVEPVFLMGALIVSTSKSGKSKELTLILDMLNAADKLQDWSLHAKGEQFSPSFAKYISQNSVAEPGTQIGGLQVCFANLQNSYRTPIEKLAAVSLPLAWWRENDPLASASKFKPISFSLHDVLNDSLSLRGYRDRQNVNFSATFWHKLLQKYLSHEAFEEEVSKQLQPEPILAAETTAYDIANDKSLTGVI